MRPIRSSVHRRKQLDRYNFPLTYNQANRRYFRITRTTPVFRIKFFVYRENNNFLLKCKMFGVSFFDFGPPLPSRGMNSTKNRKKFPGARATRLGRHTTETMSDCCCGGRDKWSGRSRVHPNKNGHDCRPTRFTLMPTAQKKQRQTQFVRLATNKKEKRFFRYRRKMIKRNIGEIFMKIVSPKTGTKRRPFDVVRF